jgi:5-methylcytosine-specific restriction endonuclease McrA
MADEAVIVEDTRSFKEILDSCVARDGSLVNYVTSDGKELCARGVDSVSFLSKYLEEVAAGSTLELSRCFYPYGPFEATLHARYDQATVVAVATAFKDAMDSCFAKVLSPEDIASRRYLAPIRTYFCNVTTTSDGHILSFPQASVGPIVQQMIMVRSMPYIRLIIADIQDAITLQSPIDPYPLRQYVPSPDVTPYFIAFREEGHCDTRPGAISHPGNISLVALNDIAKAQLLAYGPEPEPARRYHSAPTAPDDNDDTDEPWVENAPFIKGKRESVSKNMKERIVREQGGMCAWCEVTFHPIHNPYCIDHRGAVCLGGNSERSNLQALCGTCHRAKTNMDLKCNALRKHRLKAQRKARVAGVDDTTLRRQQREFLDDYV